MGPHERALRKDLRRVPAGDRSGGLAQLGLTLARVLDAATESGQVVMSARDFTAVTDQFQKVHGSLRGLQEPVAAVDPVDEIAVQRAKRRTG